MHTLIRRTALGLVLVAASATLAQAQATRTWVSGVGNDANPCSRTAPCKTFAGAISKTAAGGEINALDPGGFGAVTITKSISIVGDGTAAGVLASLTNGIIVNAGASDVVVLRNLDINGAGNGLNGIRFLAGGALYVESCTIYGFTGKGIDARPTTASQLFVTDTIIRNNPGATGGGIALTPVAPATLVATVERVRMQRNRFGLRAEDGSRATVRDSVATGNSTNGYVAFSAGVQPSTLTVESSLASDNTNNGVSAQGAAATVRLSNVVVTGNGTGLNAGGGAIVSFGNNRVAGNGADGAPTLTIGQQ
jgi:hypothetical protein